MKSRSLPLRTPHQERISAAMKLHWKKRNKYGAVKTTIDGITFDSKAEAAHYAKLRLQEKAKLISHLEIHPSWKFVINGHKIGKYTADFSFRDGDHQLHVQDVKGVKARDFTLRCKLMRALYNIDVEVVQK